ncbi:MAG: nitroreductase family protein [Desulfobacterales bacterium]|nr:nitroreductase family protein [Desulfobacterales bacterium]
MFIPLIQKRRSIRKFSDKPVESEKIDLLVEAALRSPSSRGFNPWSFVVVTDRGMLEKLSKAKLHGSAFLKKAPLGIVVCADPEKSDVWIEDASIATIFIHLAAASLGLGSCWIQIRERMQSETKTAQSYIQEVLGLPSNIQVLAMVGIGYAAEELSPHKIGDSEYEKVRLNTFKNPYKK